MIILMTLIYVGCVVLAFRVIKIRLTPWTVMVAAVVGVLMLAGIVITWKVAAPISEKVTLTRKVTLLLSNQNSKELISKVHVDMEEPVKKGTVLYESESRPNQYRVDQLTAQLAVAEQKNLEMEASVEVAAAALDEAKALETFRQAQLATVKKSKELNPQSVADLRVTVVEQSHVAAQAGVEKAKATYKEAQFALASATDSVKAAEANLEVAKLDLSQNVMRAPADGYLTYWAALEGTMTTTVITSAQGSFMDMSRSEIIAIFPQSMVNFVKSGDAVEIAFKNLPGEITTGKVDAVLEYTGEGQISSSGQIPVAATFRSRGMLPVKILLDDDELARELALGAAGAVTIYTGFAKPFHVISKIVVRMKSWMNFLPV